MPNYCCRFCRDSGRSDDYVAPIVYLWHSESYPNVRVVNSNFQGNQFPWEANSWSFTNDPLYPPASMEDRECGICQDAIELENMNSYAAVIANCQHMFHTTCLSRSFVFQERGASHLPGRRGICPMCRGSVDKVYTGAIECSYERWRRIRNQRGLQRIIFNTFSEVRGEEGEIHSPERFPYHA
ncbi:ring finger domain-containing protein [Pochonia chlamydosporia 170]|uniref:Ring finger domain-containing protein n=1 Tax=Pochonia chlamydosporia 170 TaxID=1380566 RepID=A0A219AQY5_METCM|nr:ring finger domain-containing protein [Pochonia chlamydosporia 170]OWT43203.1 ring finger domain-containing protein [Pochonia chlamydosporia 170]